MPRQGTRSRRHQKNILVPGKELEDEAVGRQYVTKASVPAYSGLTAATAFSSPPTPAAQGDDRERPDGELDEEGPR